jgi:hypothetical protein
MTLVFIFSDYIAFYFIEGYPSAPIIHSEAPNDASRDAHAFRLFRVEFEDIDSKADFLAGKAQS